MTFWDSMFPEAMDALAETPEPEKRSRTRYHIREEQRWDAVYDKLWAARAKYTRSSGLGGKLKSVRRKLADNIQIVAGIMKFIPDVDYVTPVLGVVEILLDVSGPCWIKTSGEKLYRTKLTLCLILVPRFERLSTLRP